MDDVLPTDPKQNVELPTSYGLPPRGGAPAWLGVASLVLLLVTWVGVHVWLGWYAPPMKPPCERVRVIIVPVPAR